MASVNASSCECYLLHSYRRKSHKQNELSPSISTEHVKIFLTCAFSHTELKIG